VVGPTCCYDTTRRGFFGPIGPLSSISDLLRVPTIGPPRPFGVPAPQFCFFVLLPPPSLSLISMDLLTRTFQVLFFSPSALRVFFSRTRQWLLCNFPPVRFNCTHIVPGFFASPLRTCTPSLAYFGIFVLENVGLSLCFAVDPFWVRFDFGRDTGALAPYYRPCTLNRIPAALSARPFCFHQDHRTSRPPPPLPFGPSLFLMSGRAPHVPALARRPLGVGRIQFTSRSLDPPPRFLSITPSRPDRPYYHPTFRRSPPLKGISSPKT